MGVGGAPAPIDATAFAQAMDPFGPFEPRPRLAVGVSGGSDSLALVLLADRWARVRGGSVLALTVDHGLRPGSAAEARHVAALMAGRGIAHQVLTVRIDRRTGLQAAARQQRYAALDAASTAAGILHLLIGHTADDQHETMVLRSDRGSGPDGLAGMARIVERQGVRVLRPLLDHPRAATAATCRAADVPWIDDPTNADPRYARVRLRLSGRTGRIVAGTSAAARTARAARVADRLARHVALAPEGYALADLAALVATDDALAEGAVAALLRTLGGLCYPPRRDRLRRLIDSLRAEPPRTATLGGCLLRRRPDGRYRLCREPGAIADRPTLAAGQTLLWDGRFLVTGPEGPAAEVAPLGFGWCRGSAPGAEIVAGLPALWQGTRLIAASTLAKPHLSKEAGRTFDSVFAPATPLVAPPFDVVWPSRLLIL